MSTTTKPFNLVAFIGRFQLPHLAHYDIAKHALEKGDKVLILIGSANRARAPKNPLTFNERALLWKSMLTPEEASRVIIEPLNDYRYDDTPWVEEVQTKVYQHAGLKDKIALIGHSKDASSYYLKKFPNWKNIEIKNLRKNLNATDIRTALYHMDPNDTGDGFAIAMEEVCHPSVISFMKAFRHMQAFKDLRDEYIYDQQYKKDTQYVGVPFDPSFMAVDAVVTCANHVLMVRRAKAPGKGLWALPGGYVGKKERTVDAMLRSLCNETNIDISTPILRSNITNARLLDDPERAERGRVYSYTYHIDLPMTNPPEVTLRKDDGNLDDIMWFPIGYVFDQMRGQLHEDHDEAISYFISKKK